MKKSNSFITILLVCALLCGCFGHDIGKAYRIKSDSQNGCLKLELYSQDSVVVCSFSNDSIADGGYITFKRLLRDEFPIVVYYVAPDSIFITEGNIIDFKSQGFNIFNVEEVFEPGKEHETYTITDQGKTLECRYPTYYIINTPTDTLKVERVSFIHNFTYYIEIHNYDITVRNVNMDVMEKNNTK